MALSYTLKDNAGGKLALVGKEIRAASALSAGTLNYTITATDDGGWTKDFTGAITVTAAASTLTARRSTSAGFGAIGENGPNSGVQQTTRAPTAPFLEEFEEFSITYAVFRMRAPTITAKIDDGAGAAGNTLTVTALTAGALHVGMDLQDKASSPTWSGVILEQLGGTPNGVGTYRVSGAASTVVSVSTWVGDVVEELFQGSGAQITYEAAWLDRKFAGYASIPARMPITFDGGQATKVYNYATWDKSVGHFESDRMRRPGGKSAAAAEIWTRCTLPANGSGLPVNKAATNQFADRGWGNVAVTSGNSPDPVNATAIAAVAPAAGQLTLCITPVALNLWTAGGARTVVALTDSRGTITGKGINEPSGYGDPMGDALGLSSAMERGLYYVAKQHSVVLARPSDRAGYLAKMPDAHKFRTALATSLGVNDTAQKVFINALGQNDQNAALAANASLTHTSGATVLVGRALTVSPRVYIVTQAGVADSTAPSGTDTTQDVAYGTARVRYIGSSSDASERTALAMAGKNLLINRRFRQAMSGVPVVQEAIGPHSSSSDNWMTAAAQTDGFVASVGKAYQALLSSRGAVLTGADRVISTMSLVAGSRTVNGGADDGTRSWKTSAAGNVPYFMTADGIHENNYGAHIGREAYTEFSVTGSVLALPDMGYRGSAGRARFPYGFSTVTDTTEYMASSETIISPTWAQSDPAVWVPNCAANQTASGAEQLSGNDRTIEGIVLDIGGTKTPFTYKGNAAWTIPADVAGVWAYALGTTIPANTSCKIILADRVAIGGKRPFTSRPSVTFGDRVTFGTTSQSAFLTSGTPANPVTGSYLCSVGCMVGKPVGASPIVVGIFGDSHSTGNNENSLASNAKGNYGFIQRGLDDTTGIGAVSFMLFGAPGSTLSTLSDEFGKWSIRKAMLAEVGLPFTTALNEMGGNSVGGTTAQSVLEYNAATTFVRSLIGPSRKLVATTLSPKTASTDLWTSITNQTLNPADATTGPRWGLVDYIKTKPTGVDYVIDMTSYWSDPAQRDRWRMPGRSGTVTADIVTSSNSIQLSFAPNVGDWIIVNQGTGNAVGREVTAVTGTSAPFTVSVRGAPFSGGTVSSGALVVCAPTDDGLHGITSSHVYASQAIVEAKALGAFT